MTTRDHEPPALEAKETAPEPRPGFLAAWRGVWRFTWKSQMTWRRLPAAAISLLILPVLVYITTPLPGTSWAGPQVSFGNPAADINGLARRLSRAGSELRPDQRAELSRICHEEYARAEREANEADAAAASDTSDNAQTVRLRAALDRIHKRAQTVLDETQMAQFQNFERRKLMENSGRPRQPRWSRAAPFYHWLIDLYFFVMLPLVCVRACGALIRDEVQADTLGFLATRPVSRARLVIVKYLSQAAWLQIVVLVEAMLLFTAGQLRQIPALGTLVGLFVGIQFLAVLAWSALGTLLGLVTNRYMALAIVYGTIVEMGIGRIPTNINNLSLMRHLKTLLAYNPALRGVYQWTDAAVALPVGALLLATALLLTLAAVLFTFREYHHTAEMQK